MVNTVSWFAFKALICVGTVPDLPMLNSEVLLMSTPLLSFGGKKESIQVFWTVVGDFARLLPAAFASLLFRRVGCASVASCRLRWVCLWHGVVLSLACWMGLLGVILHFASFGFGSSVSCSLAHGGW